MKGYKDNLRVFSIKLIQSIDYMKDLSDVTLEEISYHLEQEHFEQNKIIFRAGEPIDRVYFIVNGIVNISVNVDDREIIIDSISQGCSIGWNGILGQFNHNFTARASSKLTLYYLTRDNIKTLMNVWQDLDFNITSAQEYYETSDMPWVDFRVSRLQEDSISPLKILKISIARLLRLKRNMLRKHSAAEIVEVLKELQIKYNKPSFTSVDCEDSNKYTADIVEKLLKRFDKMQYELNAQKQILLEFVSRRSSSKIDNSGEWNIDTHSKGNKKNYMFPNIKEPKE